MTALSWSSRKAAAALVGRSPWPRRCEGIGRAGKLLRVAVTAAALCCLATADASAISERTECEARKTEAAGQRQACLAVEYAKAMRGQASSPAACNRSFKAALAAIERALGVKCAFRAPPGALGRTGARATYGASDDGSLRLGARPRYVDNGDGTISDLNTGLLWEKKSDDGSVHDWNNGYSWSATRIGTAFDGTVVTVFLEKLNNRCSSDETVACSSDSDCSGVGGPCGFAGYRDWRLPNVRELESIEDLGRGDPAVFPVFNQGCAPGCAVSACSCTTLHYYWSSTTGLYSPDYAWVVSSSGHAGPDLKGEELYARAVRGGS